MLNSINISHVEINLQEVQISDVAFLSGTPSGSWGPFDHGDPHGT
jgi:hypothetical protein